MKLLGIIGGMSTASSISYYQKINEHINQLLGANHGARLVIYNLDFEEIAQLQKQGNWQQAGEILADAAKRLVLAGVDGILLATNTMHKVAGNITDAIDVPFLHLIDITAQAIAEQGLDKVGLLGTSFSMTDGFYQTTLVKYGIQTIIPSESDQKIVHRIIYDELCLNQIKPSAAEQYIQIIETLKAQGAQAVILGCTEIGLLINEENSPLPVFDTTLLHIDAAVAWMSAQ